MNVLIVEDNTTTAYLLKQYLEAHGYQATQSGYPDKALQLLRLNQFDAVVLDYILPEHDGLSVLRVMRQDPRITNKALPVVVVTGLDPQTVRSFQGALHSYDPVSVLCKPVDPAKIVSEIQRLSPPTDDTPLVPDPRESE